MEKNEHSPIHFPSGAWTGWYIQNRRSWLMRVRLTFDRGKVEGEGQDNVGKFVVFGTYSEATGLVSMMKHYRGAHTVKYDGFSITGRRINGMWTLPRIRAIGEWMLRPIDPDGGDDPGGGGEEAPNDYMEHEAEPRLQPA